VSENLRTHSKRPQRLRLFLLKFNTFNKTYLFVNPALFSLLQTTNSINFLRVLTELVLTTYYRFLSLNPLNRSANILSPAVAHWKVFYLILLIVRTAGRKRIHTIQKTTPRRSSYCLTCNNHIRLKFKSDLSENVWCATGDYKTNAGNTCNTILMNSSWKWGTSCQKPYGQCTMWHYFS
jgi:hypothetical protein